MRKILLISISIFFWVDTLQAQDNPKPDTLEIGGVTILRDNEEDLPKEEKKGFFKKLSSAITPKNIKTEWAIVDLGVSNYVDNTNYESEEAQAYAPMSNEAWMKLRPFKSRNVNIWLVTQQYNLVQHYINLRYGLGVELNNYSFKQPIRFHANTEALKDAPVIALDETPERIYKKNKLAVDYITIPVMFNFNLTPYRLYPFEISAGVSVGYLYTARNKVVNSDEGKTKTRGDFDLRPWKLSYVAELNLGFVRLYGSYAFKSMYKRGFDVTPYNFGIRLRPVEILAKIETN